MIDTHCHLTFPDFEGRIGAVLDEARAAGVTGAITVCTTSRGARDVLALARAHPHVWCTAGVHPLYAAQDARDWPAMLAVAAQPECVAWGELGLDRHHPEPPLDLQHAVLEEQLALITRADRDGLTLPIVIHCRKAVQDLLPVLRNSGLSGDRFVFHCFTESPQDARAVLDFGACLSFTGVVTYRNADDVRRSAALAPIDRIMVETDAPYLSPEPVRGQRPCAPAMAMHTARRLADLRAMPLADFLDAVDSTTHRFFGVRAPAPDRPPHHSPPHHSPPAQPQRTRRSSP